jgi:protein-tyrosine-phosphatase
MPSILFICTANQFRSPLAAAILRKHLATHPCPGDWHIASAGTWTQPGLPAAASAIKLAQKLSLPGLNDHTTQTVTQQLLDGYDLILMMEVGQLEAIASEFHTVFGRSMLLSEVVDGVPYDIPDPIDVTSDPSEVASELQMLIEKGAGKILKLAKTLHEARNISGEMDHR